MAKSDSDCVICGNCWWEGCDNPADHEDDVELKRRRLPVYSGVVDLCDGHHKHAMLTGRMNLKWAAIEQAIARQKERSG